MFTSKYFQPYGEAFDDTFAFVGASVEHRDGEYPFSIEFPDDRQLIYISLGTTKANENEHFYQDCIKAFSGMEVNVLMSVGDNIDIHSLGEVPENVIVRQSAPQLQVLEHAALFITHGGMNSVTEALHYEVPMLLFPQHGDQYANASRVIELGAGIILEGNAPNFHEQIREAALAVLEDGIYKYNAGQISETLRSSGGVKKAVGKITILKEQGIISI